MPPPLCICSLVPRLDTRTRVSVVVHHREARKPSNTGKLAARCLTRGTIAIVGKPGMSGPPALDVADAQPVVLFPAEDARPIEQFASTDTPIALIVPDGNWHQARQMSRQRLGLGAIPCVTLPALGPSEYRLREEPWPAGLATLEAVARALRVLEAPRGAEIEAAMLGVFRIMVERTLWYRGKLAADDVTGGIPLAAREHDPRGAMTIARAIT